MARRQQLVLTVVLAFVVFFSISYLFSNPSKQTTKDPINGGYGRELDFLPVDQPAVPLKPAPEGSNSAFQVDLDSMPAAILEGDSIAPKLEIATLKYAPTFILPNCYRASNADAQ